MIRIAILDDSKAVTMSIHKYLEGLAEIKEFNDVDTFLADVRINHYELLFIDINLPRKNGLDVVNEIKDFPHLKETKIVIVTAEKTDTYRKVAKELGVNAYIKKPFSEKTLQNIVKMFFRGRL